MIRRMLDWILGRREPELNHRDKARRLQVLTERLEVVRRGK